MSPQDGVILDREPFVGTSAPPMYEDGKFMPTQQLKDASRHLHRLGRFAAATVMEHHSTILSSCLSFALLWLVWKLNTIPNKSTSGDATMTNSANGNRNRNGKRTYLPRKATAVTTTTCGTDGSTKKSLWRWPFRKHRERTRSLCTGKDDPADDGTVSTTNSDDGDSSDDGESGSFFSYSSDAVALTENDLLRLDRQLVSDLRTVMDGEADVNADHADATETAVSLVPQQERFNFLRGNNGNVAKSVKQLAFTIQWRQQMQQTVQSLSQSEQLQFTPTNPLVTQQQQQQQQQQQTTHKPSEKERNESPPSGHAVEDDTRRWNVATMVAARHRNDRRYDAARTVPRLIRHTLRCNSLIQDADGTAVFLILPAILDDTLAEPSTYSLALAYYLHLYFEQHQHDAATKISLLVDLRPGQGWRNCHALKLVSTLREGISLLTQIFPERLHQCVLVPIPKSYFWLWSRCIQPCLDVRTKRKIGVICGLFSVSAPTPVAELVKYIPREMVDAMHRERLSEFVDDSSASADSRQ